MKFIFEENYVLAVCENYPPFVIDYDTYNGKTVDEIEEHVLAIQAFYDITQYMREFEDPDDWE